MNKIPEYRNLLFHLQIWFPIRVSSGQINRILTSKFSSEVEPQRIEKTINCVQLLGRVGADPQRKGSEERPIAVFSLATHTNYR
nr:unnamed protein product [Callosobruchus analis]